MKWMDKLAAHYGYQKPQKRQFAAAAVNRLTSTWTGTYNSLDRDLASALPRLRARARELAQNNDYVRRYLSMVAANIAGLGVAVQMQARFSDGRPDASLNDSVELAFDRWATQPEITGRMNWAETQRLVARSVAMDGEALIRIVARGGRLQLQLLDPTLLDDNYNDATRRIVMGVETTAEGAPIAYHVLTAHPGDTVTQRTRERIPAEQIIHLFRSDRPQQTRGVTWLHTAMKRLNDLAGYEEAAIIAARVGAAKMGFFTSPDGDLSPLADDSGSAGELFSDAEPGKFGMLPPGFDFKAFDPDYPHEQYGVFVKAQLRGVAAGLGVAYHNLAGDLEAVNFSSARAGTLEERDNWMQLQDWFVAGFVRPVFEQWLSLALLSGEITVPTSGGPLTMGADATNKILTGLILTGRRWAWVDPMKDVQANILAIDAGLKSRREVVNEQGRDLDDVWANLAREKTEAERLGILTKGTANGMADQTDPNRND
jgi:lambda family phage portal protein